MNNNHSNETDNYILNEIFKLAVKPEQSIMITPQMAQVMLEKNENNRNLKQGTIRKYESHIRNNHFVLSNDMVCFDSNGILWNGQHRLSAIVNSGIPSKLFVAYGIEPSPYLDRGARRTASDNIRLNTNIKDVRSEKATIDMFHCFERMVGLDTTDEAIDIWIANEYKNELISFFIDIPNMKKRNNNIKYAYVVCAFFLAYLNGIDKNLLADCSKVLDGEYVPGEKFNHMVKLKDKIKNINQSRQIMREECFPRTINAIDSVIKRRKSDYANRKVNKLKWDMIIMGKSIKDSYNHKQNR